jgi:hypothetical protein
MFARLHRGTAGTGILAATAIALAANAPAGAPADEDAQIAKSLAGMLRAGRTVVSRHQDSINDPNLGNKGFDSQSVLAEALKIYQGAASVDPMSIDPNSRHGKLIRMQMAAIGEVFGRLTNESFGRRAIGLAEMKVTAPPQFIRNAKAKADDWESGVIRDKLLTAAWPKEQPFAAVAQSKGKTAHRTAVPEYYGASCLSCHGSPQGEIDITGYPKEGGHEGDLGGVISITLYK